MFLNNLKTAYRHLRKNLTFSLINIFGLTLGFLCFILIALYIHDELNFDGMHKDAQLIYRILQHEKTDDGEIRNVATVAGQIGPESQRQFPEVTDVCRLAEFGRVTMGNDPETRTYERMIVADSNFFQFFDFELIHGSPKKALNEANSVVINETLANRYFGSTDVLGKTVWVNGDDVSISGVMKDFPTNSHLQIELLLSGTTANKYYSRFQQFESTDWQSNSFATYVKLNQADIITSLSQKITNLAEQNYPVDRTFSSKFSLQPLKDIHLYSQNLEDYQFNPSGFSPFYLYMFSVVGFLILLIAALNYMNLSTAAAFKRTSEIGTRKTLGAAKASLILQFIGEAILLSLFSLVVALAVGQIFLPSINEFLNKELSLYQLPGSWIFVILVTLIGSGILAAAYPALVVSRVSPALAMKKEIRLTNKSVPIRKILVVAQFTISIVMIASTLIIYQQLSYVREKELGFDVENLVAIDINSGRLRRQFESVKNEFTKLPEVQSVTVSSRVPGEWKTFPIASVHRAGTDIKGDMIFVGIDQDFLETFDINVTDGRNFSDSKTDSSKVILTQLAVERLGLQNPIGQKILIPVVRFGGEVESLPMAFEAEVIGVVDNFYFESFKAEMRPLIFAYHNNPIQSIDYYTLRINTRNWDQTLSSLRKVNADFDPNNPVEYNFLDGKFAEFYENDIKRGNTFLAFSAVIIVIASLGLFALVSFSVEHRRKEIGVRKVLGASANSIMLLLSREFLTLVIISFTIATPLIIISMRGWLTEFAYHINIGPGIFIVTGIIALLIAFVTISFRSIKAAITNPVESLRNE